MIRLIGLLVILFLFENEKEPFDNSSFIQLSDSTEFDISPVFDSLDMLKGYQSYLFTPICEEDKCYAVEIDFYWDQIGRFVRYDTIPGQPLTKLDHDPFLASDYAKLMAILRNRNSVLRNYKKEELVQDTRTSEVDGTTGATIQEVKDNVIEGAVYSCYTLWHIAHGTAVDRIQKSTLNKLSKPLVQQMISQRDQEINYFLISHFTAEEFEEYLPEVLKTIEYGEGYYPKNAIEFMPENVVSDSLVQDFFVKNFNQFNYFSQLALLKKLSPETLSKELALVIKNELDDRKSTKNVLIMELLGNKP